MMRVLTFALAMAFVLAGASLDTSAQSDAPTIKIGYAISRTGPFAPGAQATQEPSYILWAEQVNAAGGINVKGQKRKVELISYDDRSEVETIVRTFEKLMVTDKVDLISCRPGAPPPISPWPRWPTSMAIRCWRRRPSR